MNIKILAGAGLAAAMALGLPGHASADVSAQAVEKYVVKGRVLSSTGTPVKGAKIVVSWSLQYNTHLVLYSDAKGYYRGKMPRKLGTWTARGYLNKTYHGQRYSFTLSPSSTKSFKASTGAIRNFTWKLTGRRGDGRYYGGLVNYNLWSDNVPDGEWLAQENVRLRLTPVTTLIDGSTGKVISGRTPIWQDPYGWSVVDIPLARYKITATYEAPGKPVRALWVKKTGTTAFGWSATSDFQQDGTNQRIRLEVKLPDPQ